MKYKLLKKSITDLENNINYKNIYLDDDKKLLPNCASLIITEKCNLNCNYCFVQQSNKTMSDEVIKQSISFLYDSVLHNQKIDPSILNNYDDNHVGLMLFGGEPTLFPKHLNNIFTICNLKTKYTNIPAEIELITNATIMTKYLYNSFKNIIKYYNNIKFRVQLSIDGNKDCQDKNRPTKYGNRSSFDLIEKNINYYLELFKNNPYGLTIHGCLTKYTIPYLFENYKMFKKWGFKHIWFIPIQEEDWQPEDYNQYYLEMKNIYLDILEDAIQQKSIEPFRLYSPLNSCLDRLSKNKNAKPCGAGVNFISITPNGDIYPCHQYYTEKRNDQYSYQLTIGNIFVNNPVEGYDYYKKRIYEEYDGSDLLCDTDCNCLGDKCFRCLSVNYMYKGSMFITPKKGYCEFMKIDNYFQDLAKKAIKFYNLNSGE